jgi:hypothetical protein
MVELLARASRWPAALAGLLWLGPQTQTTFPSLVVTRIPK